MLHPNDFSYGLLTPALGYLMSCLGSFLGLRCTARARALTGAARARWLALAALSIGITGIWVMHFIAMLGYTIPGEVIRYNVALTAASMLIAVAVVGVGLFIVGFGGDSYRPLLLGGVIAGLGVASMHYLGMAALRMPAAMNYSPVLVMLSVVIAIVAATAALWAALRLGGIGSTLGAALIMGVAVSGMHYTGMAAMTVHAAAAGQRMLMGGATAEGFLLPLIVGICVLSFAVTATIALSPSEAEIRNEADLMERIAAARADRLSGRAAYPVALLIRSRCLSGRAVCGRAVSGRAVFPVALPGAGSGFPRGGAPQRPAKGAEHAHRHQPPGVYLCCVRQHRGQRERHRDRDRAAPVIADHEVVPERAERPEPVSHRSTSPGGGSVPGGTAACRATAPAGVVAGTAAAAATARRRSTSA